MVNGKMPLALTVLAAAVFLTLMLLIQPYSVDGGAYAKPAHRYIEAALRSDSVRLTRLSASERPVAWALDVARRDAGTLGLWRGYTTTSRGLHRGDTTEVFLYPTGVACSKSPIQFRFVGSEAKAKVLSARSACLDS